jgi:hypothetical protein
VYYNRMQISNYVLKWHIKLANLAVGVGFLYLPKYKIAIQIIRDNSREGWGECHGNCFAF